MSERTLLLGFDLGEEKSQMAVYDREKNIPVLIGQTEENPEGLIPRLHFRAKSLCGIFLCGFADRKMWLLTAKFQNL